MWNGPHQFRWVPATWLGSGAGGDDETCTPARILRMARPTRGAACTRFKPCGPRAADVTGWLNPTFHTVSQPEGGLGGKLEHAFVRAFQNPRFLAG